MSHGWLHRPTSSLCAIAMVALVTGCGGDDETSEPTEDPAPIKNLERTCVAPDGMGSPKTIEEVVALINALPKPTSSACFLESLDRPLTLFATSGILSVQPAVSLRSPRVFILIDDLVISVVPEGVNVDLLEFAYLVSDSRSIKGELEMPATEDVPEAQPYDRIRLDTGTKCGGCHLGEVLAEDITSTDAFVSGALKPPNSEKVELSYLVQHCLDCDASVEPKRCEMMNAIFGHGQVLQGAFPEDMPEFLD